MVGSPQPWQMKPLDQWSIVGMNHYFIDGERRLYVAMVKGNLCIKEEGKDDEYLWNRLWHKAVEVNTHERAFKVKENSNG